LFLGTGGKIKEFVCPYVEIAEPMLRVVMIQESWPKAPKEEDI